LVWTYAGTFFTYFTYRGGMIGVGPSQTIEIRRFAHGKWQISGLKGIRRDVVANVAML